jgi:glyoxylase-like metal-dependent hydrolase (beta-lactamase superfamily II)
MPPTVRAFFREATLTASYFVTDPASGRAAVVDPALDFDVKSGRTGHKSADGILAAAAASGAEIVWILETHAHADHLSAAAYLKERTGGATGIGAAVRDVQPVFKPIFNALDLEPDRRQFDRLFADEEHFAIGKLDARVTHAPGHTPGTFICVTGSKRRISSPCGRRATRRSRCRR